MPAWQAIPTTSTADMHDTHATITTFTLDITCSNYVVINLAIANQKFLCASHFIQDSRQHTVQNYILAENDRLDKTRACWKNGDGQDMIQKQSVTMIMG